MNGTINTFVARVTRSGISDDSDAEESVKPGAGAGASVRSTAIDGAAVVNDGTGTGPGREAELRCM